ncbi:hypothetical protein [Nocardiopsis kunsanensis]|uniref:hypothetical protein n=1 Tax=Nocardiopsis kunsanensis TaxID=141693 RepID=UPI00034D5592|nr:hypothetical protein [Nocardiopsis kunsanensis]
MDIQEAQEALRVAQVQRGNTIAEGNRFPWVAWAVGSVGLTGVLAAVDLADVFADLDDSPWYWALSFVSLCLPLVAAAVASAWWELSRAPVRPHRSLHTWRNVRTVVVALLLLTALTVVAAVGFNGGGVPLPNVWSGLFLGAALLMTGVLVSRRTPAPQQLGQ